MTDNLRAVVTPIAIAKKTADGWKAEAEKRRRISAHDPMAEVLDFCAAELRENLRPFENPTRMRTVAEVAADEDVSPQAVRGWIVRGEMPAVRKGGRWLIPAGVRRERKSA